MDNIEEFGEYDEPVLTSEQETEIYGEIPTDEINEMPQTHGLEESYENGDISEEGENNETSN